MDPKTRSLKDLCLSANWNVHFSKENMKKNQGLETLHNAASHVITNQLMVHMEKRNSASSNLCTILAW